MLHSLSSATAHQPADLLQFIEAMFQDDRLTPTAKVVGARLVLRQDCAVASANALASECAISRSAAYLALNALVDAEWICRDKDGYRPCCPNSGSAATSIKILDDQASLLPEMEILPPALSKRSSVASVASIAHGFAEWWRQYPRRVARGNAEKAYARVIRSGMATSDELLAGAMRYAAEKQHEEPKYIKHPASWLNAKCWLDEPDRKPPSHPGSTADGIMNILRGMEYPQDAKLSGADSAVAGIGDFLRRNGYIDSEQ